LLPINIFNLQHFFSYSLHLLDVSRAQWSCLLRRTCEVKSAKRRCNSLWTTTLNTLWYVRYFILFRKLLFFWIKCKWSWTLDHRLVIHVRLFFGRLVLGTTNLLLLLQLCHCFSLIFFSKHIKFLMNIWMNII
jgi:hypothetical protein